MINLLKKILSFTKPNKFFLLFKKYTFIVLKYYVKTQMTFLYSISTNIVLYFIYIFLVMYSLFGCSDSLECNASHYVSMFTVLYIMTTSLELFIMYKLPFTKSFLDNLLGIDFALKYYEHFSSFKQLFKYWGVVYGVVGFDILTHELGFNYMRYKVNLLEKAFDEMYGDDAMKWHDNVKEDYAKQQKALFESNWNRGLITNIFR